MSERLSKRVTTDDGQDITEAVQILYDIAHSSMDWGSGFLDNEEMETVIRLAVLMGWQVPDLPYSTNMDSPMETVARKFPDHYEIEVVDHPPTSYSPQGFTSHRIKVRPRPQKGPRKIREKKND